MRAEIVLGLAAAFFVTTGAEAAPEMAAAVSPPERAFSVTPGATATPLTTAWPKGGAPLLVWTGFQVTDAGSRVFVQVSRDVAMDVQTVKGGLAVTLRNCRIHMRNNSRTLDTRFFTTPVKEVSVHQRHNGVVLDIALKEPASATPRKEAGPAGSQFWVLDFAPAAAAKASPRPPVDHKASAPKDIRHIKDIAPSDRKPETASVE